MVRNLILIIAIVLSSKVGFAKPVVIQNLVFDSSHVQAVIYPDESSTELKITVLVFGKISPRVLIVRCAGGARGYVPQLISAIAKLAEFLESASDLTKVMDASGYTDCKTEWKKG